MFVPGSSTPSMMVTLSLRHCAELFLDPAAEEEGRPAAAAAAPGMETGPEEDDGQMALQAAAAALAAASRCSSSSGNVGNYGQIVIKTNREKEYGRRVNKCVQHCRENKLCIAFYKHETRIRIRTYVWFLRTFKRCQMGQEIF